MQRSNWSHQCSGMVGQGRVCQRVALLGSVLLGVQLAVVSGQHGNGMNSPNGIDLGALLGGGAGGGGGQKAYCSKKGQVLVPKTDYFPAANGCGPTGMRQKNGDRWRLHECCNGHDTCYVNELPALQCTQYCCLLVPICLPLPCTPGRVWREPHLL